MNEGLKTIETDAFARCNNLHRITIPRSVTKIREGVFDRWVGDGLAFCCYPGTSGLVYARAHGIPVRSAELIGKEIIHFNLGE